MDYRFVARIRWEEAPDTDLMHGRLHPAELTPSAEGAAAELVLEGDDLYVYGIADRTSVRDILEQMRATAAELGQVDIYAVEGFEVQATEQAVAGASPGPDVTSIVFAPPAVLDISRPHGTCKYCHGVGTHIPCYPCNPCE